MKYRPSPPLRLLRRFLRSIEHNGFGGALAESWQLLYRSLKNHGLVGTLERAFVKAPAPAPSHPAAPRQPHSFDSIHGTDTGGNYSAADFESVSLSALYGTGYLGVPPSALRPALAALPIRFEDFSFVDIGAGKGRALFVAAEFPFRHLFGVEIAGKLCEVARANAALKPEWKDRVSIVNEDATKFVYPEGPLVLFLYYPFFSPILRRFLASLERQLRRSPRDIYLLHADFYVDPADTDSDYLRYRKAIDSFRMLKLVSETAYPLAEEDAAMEVSGCTTKRIALYTAHAGR